MVCCVGCSKRCWWICIAWRTKPDWIQQTNMIGHSKSTHQHFAFTTIFHRFAGSKYPERWHTLFGWKQTHNHTHKRAERESHALLRYTEDKFSRFLTLYYLFFFYFFLFFQLLFSVCVCIRWGGADCVLKKLTEHKTLIFSIAEHFSLFPSLSRFLALSCSFSFSLSLSILAFHGAVLLLLLLLLSCIAFGFSFISHLQSEILWPKTRGILEMRRALPNRKRTQNWRAIFIDV